MQKCYKKYEIGKSRFEQNERKPARDVKTAKRREFKGCENKHKQSCNEKLTSEDCT